MENSNKRLLVITPVSASINTNNNLFELVIYNNKFEELLLHSLIML